MRDASQARPLLTDGQCRKFLKDMHEFGFPKLTFEKVREVANDIHQGRCNRADVVSVMMLKEIDAALEDSQ